MRWCELPGMGKERSAPGENEAFPGRSAFFSRRAARAAGRRSRPPGSADLRTRSRVQGGHLPGSLVWGPLALKCRVYGPDSHPATEEKGSSFPLTGRELICRRTPIIPRHFPSSASCRSSPRNEGPFRRLRRHLSCHGTPRPPGRRAPHDKPYGGGHQLERRR